MARKLVNRKPRLNPKLRELLRRKPLWHNETEDTIARHAPPTLVVPPGFKPSVMPMPFAESAKPSNPKDVMSLKKVPLLSVVPLNVLAQLALGLLEGALKYSRHNYRIVGVRASVYVDATARHLAQFWEGQDFDPDSKANLHHIDKAIASLVVLSDSIKRGNWVDDRPPRCDEHGNWIEESNKIAEQLVKQCSNPVPPTTQKLIDEAHARGEEPVLPTGRRE